MSAAVHRVRPMTALAAVALVAVACRAGADEGDGRPESDRDGVEHAEQVAAPAIEAPVADTTFAPHVVCGINFVHAWQAGGHRGYGSDASAGQLDELADLGVQSVAITTFAWMQGLADVEVHSTEHVGASETADRMRAVAEQARARGLDVMYKPHLWIGRGAWRGDIDPDPALGGWPAWFDSYESWVVAQAQIAEDTGATWFVVGVEFVSAVREDPERWRRIIAAVRGVYSGRVTYAANWDEVEHVPFWDGLDAVGVQMFAPLSEADDATPEQMREGAARWLARYEAVAQAVDRPLVLTEVGYMNRAGTTRDPWVWPERLPAGDHGEGDAEQAEAWGAIVATFGRSERVAGIWWWKWFTDPDTDEEGPIGFSPRGRPAEQVLRGACAGR